MRWFVVTVVAMRTYEPPKGQDPQASTPRATALAIARAEYTLGAAERAGP